MASRDASRLQQDGDIPICGLYRNVESDRLEFSQHSSKPTLTDADYCQRCMVEEIERLNRLSHTIGYNLAEDELEINQAIAQTNNLADTSQVAVETAEEQAIAIEEIQQEAQKALNYWMKELAVALNWLKKAQARLIKAMEQLQKAEKELQTAEKHLKLANVGLMTCRLNPWQKDCSAEKARQQKAKSTVLQAKH